MPSQTISRLKQKFAHAQNDNSLSFQTGKGGIPVIEVFNPHASALISLQGAQVLSWIPKNEDGLDAEDVIWLSQDACFAPGKSVRGGIPICWPWFGQHPENLPAYPAHGFARTCLWQVDATEILDDDSTRIQFSLQRDSLDAQTQAMWPTGASVSLMLTIGHRLELELITRNNGDTPLQISEALHTYFRIGDIDKVLLHGLDDTDYLDKPDNFKRKHQHGPVMIEGEIDRVYLDTETDCVIEDRSLGRNIIIIKCGSHSTVVWNPGEAVAAKMGDLGPDGYRQMLCVESGNMADNTVTIAPGKTHQLWVQYEVQ